MGIPLPANLVQRQDVRVQLTHKAVAALWFLGEFKPRLTSTKLDTVSQAGRTTSREKEWQDCPERN